jgi:hypothetical protein
MYIIKCINFKDLSILTLYTLLNTPTLTFNYEINTRHFI